MEMNFCRRCGMRLKTTDNHLYFCTNGHNIYLNSSPTTSVFIITDRGTVLLGRRGVDPFKGALDSIGGFLDGSETFEAGASRELKEESGITSDEYGPLHYLCSATQDYEFGGETNPVVSVFFWSRLGTDRPLQADDDIIEIVECPIDQTTLQNIAADDVRAGFQALIDQKETFMR